MNGRTVHKERDHHTDQQALPHEPLSGRSQSGGLQAKDGVKTQTRASNTTTENLMFYVQQVP